LKDKAEIVIRGWNAITQTVKITDDKTDRSAEHAEIERITSFGNGPGKKL